VAGFIDDQRETVLAELRVKDLIPGALG